MSFKKTIALIVAIISVIVVVSLGGCFGGDGETESVTTESVKSSEIIDSESKRGESEESEKNSYSEIDNINSSKTSEENAASEKGSESVESSESEESIESEIIFTVIFDSTGGSKVEAVKVKSGEKIPEPPTPRKATFEKQYVFKGWYIGDSKWDFKNGIVTGDITLTAKWELTGDFTVGF